MAGHRPLAGVRVLELGIGFAAPLAGRYLAHYGAEVIKVESADHPDVTRLLGPGWIPVDRFGRRVHMDLAAHFNDLNAGKLSTGVDLKLPEGRQAVKRILSHSDVLLTNYSPEAVASLGLDYAPASAVKPDIVYVSLSGFGSTPDTPYHGYIAWGPNLSALCGLDELTAPSGGPLLGLVGTAYSDFLGAILGVVAVLAALRHRRRTGQGQEIDLSQFESAVGLLAPSLADYQTNGRMPARAGNRLPWAAPQGVYRCRGEDRWVAISVLTERMWQCFCQVAGHPEWVVEPCFATTDDRIAHHDELDALIAEWTVQHTADEVAAWLQRAGVAASIVLDHPGVLVDPQLAARDFWLLPEHARWGRDLVSGNPIHMSLTPGHIEGGAASIGQDNSYVLGDLCGYTDAELNDLIRKRAVFPMDRPEVVVRRRYLPWIRHLMPQLPWPQAERTE